NGVGDGGSDADRTGLADAARRFAGLHEMDFDDRRFVDPQHAIVVEIALLDAAALEGNFAPQGCAQAKNNAAFDLRNDRVGIDHLAAIDGADDAPDFDLAFLRHFDFGDLR